MLFIHIYQLSLLTQNLFYFLKSSSRHQEHQEYLNKEKKLNHIHTYTILAHLRQTKAHVHIMCRGS